MRGPIGLQVGQTIPAYQIVIVSDAIVSDHYRVRDYDVCVEGYHVRVYYYRAGSCRIKKFNSPVEFVICAWQIVILFMFKV